MANVEFVDVSPAGTAHLRQFTDQIPLDRRHRPAPPFSSGAHARIMLTRRSSFRSVGYNREEVRTKGPCRERS